MLEGTSSSLVAAVRSALECPSAELIAWVAAAGEPLHHMSREVVAIDWEDVGWGAVGADLATLVVGTMRRGDFDVERAEELDSVAFGGYVDGLAEAGWRDSEAARRGYCASVGLRWPIIASAPESPLARFVLARTAEIDRRGRVTTAWE